VCETLYAGEFCRASACAGRGIYPLAVTGQLNSLLDPSEMYPKPLNYGVNLADDGFVRPTSDPRAGHDILHR
jgi:hypothetical protein